jgi:hypothetical protein
MELEKVFEKNFNIQALVKMIEEYFDQKILHCKPC